MEELKKVDSIIPSGPSKFPMSNVWIRGVYQWGNIEKMLFDTALAKPEKRYDPASKKVKTVAMVSVSEINALQYKSGGANYERAKRAADNLSKAFIRIADPEHNRYTHINMLERVTYDNGMFTVVFTDSVVGMGYISPKRDYTTVLQAVNRLQDAYSIKLYQLLRSRCFGKTDENGCYTWTVMVDELKLLMGYINVEDEEFYKSEKENGLESDDLHVIEILKQKKGRGNRSTESVVPYQAFADFRKKVLDKYLKEINELMDISAEWKKVQTQGHKIEKIRFYIRFNDRNKPSDEEIRKLVFSMNDFITARDAGWTASQLRELLTEARYSVDIVREKYRMLMKQDDSKIKNRFGWLLDAIRYNYEDSDADNIESIVEEPVTMDTFDRAWELYQKKTRKDMITKRVRRNINSIGFEEMEKAIRNYESVIEENKRSGFNRQRMSGGAWFTGGYIDYLDDVFKRKTSEEKGYIGKASNSFTAGTARTKMDYEAMAEKEEMDKVINGFD